VLRVDESTQKIALGMKQLTENPWSTVGATYAVGQVRTGRVTRVAEFGAFVELEAGIEALAHASTFPPTGRREEWTQSVPVGMSGAFEILSIDPEQRRIGVALVDEGSARARGSAEREGGRPASAGIVPGARLTGKVERHEKFGVFVFLAPGRTGLMPMSETGVAKDATSRRRFPPAATSRSSYSKWIHRADGISSQPQSGAGCAGRRGAARVCRTHGCVAGRRFRIARRQAPRCARTREK